MVDIALIAGAVSSLKNASDIASSLIGVRDQAIVQQKVIELQRIIMEAQSGALAAQGQQYELQDTVRGLKQQLEHAAAWSTVASRYQLKEFGTQSFAYVLREEFAEDEPRHILCSKCYSEKILSPLAYSHTNSGTSYYDCHVCDKRRSLNGRL